MSNEESRNRDGNLQLPSTSRNPVEGGAPGPEDASPARKRLKSPTASVNADRTRSPSPTSHPKPRHKAQAEGSTLPAPPPARTKGRLWNEVDPITTCSQAAQAVQEQPRQARCRDNKQAGNQTVEEEDPSVNKMIGQPETRPISQEQQLAELRGVYAGLEMFACEDSDMETRLAAQEKQLPVELRSSPGAPRTSCRARERRFIPLEVNGVRTYALPDTGVFGNAICEDYALDIGATIERPAAKHHFMNAKNRTFESVGTTKLSITIPGALSENSAKSERQWICTFAVVKHLAAPLVLGSQFLQKTQALANLAHLMVKKTMSVMSDKLKQLRNFWMFMHMDLPTQKLGCSLDAEPAFASLDSGSDIDVVSLSYAKSRQWQIESIAEGEGYVLLANSELVKLAGYVDTTLGIRGGCIRRRLYVPDGLVCDVVLGDPTIEALDIFNEFRSSLVGITFAEDTDPFHMIQWVEEMNHFGHELEGLLAEGAGVRSSDTAKTGWRSFFRRGTQHPDRSAEGE